MDQGDTIYVADEDPGSAYDCSSDIAASLYSSDWSEGPDESVQRLHRQDIIEELLDDEIHSADEALQEYSRVSRLGPLFCIVDVAFSVDELDDRALYALSDWNSRCVLAAESHRLASKERRWLPFDAHDEGMYAAKTLKPDKRAVDLAPLSILATSMRPTTLRQAWDQNNHEAVVSLSSSLIEQRASAPDLRNADAVRELCAALRHRFLAYESMGLATLAVADAKRILELTAKFGAAADIEVDDRLLPVLASVDGASVPNAQVGGGEISLKREAEDLLGGSLLKRPKGGDQLVVRKCRIISLPHEILLMIAEHLSAADRIKLANVRHDWRNIPELWRSLEFKRVINTTCTGWQRDTIDACITAIQTCQRRSHNTLSAVVLKGYLASHGLARVLEALQPSSATLKHLAIPTSDQKQCYVHLYQRSPNLTAIDVRLPRDLVTHSSLHSTTSMLFDVSKLPFTLKTFISDLNINCGDIAPHMTGLEVVHGLSFARQKRFNFIDGLARAAPTLIEWRDDASDRWDNTTVVLGDYGISREQLPKNPILFPKLRKLSALWAEHFIECSFPALEEARLNCHRGPQSLNQVSGDDHQSRIAAVILKSPSLKKLDILMPSTPAAVNQIFNAIATLPNLQELGLWATSSLSLSEFVQAQKSVNDDDAFLILPNLHTLRLCYRSIPGGRDLERELSELLLLRFFLKKGCKHGEAKTRTQAALLAYLPTQMYSYATGMTKTQRKKAINTSAAEAAGSCYKGDFTMVDGFKRENFRPVLPNLVVTRGHSKILVEGVSTLIGQLVGRVVEVDTSKQFSEGNLRHERHGYY